MTEQRGKTSSRVRAKHNLINIHEMASFELFTRDTVPPTTKITRGRCSYIELYELGYADCRQGAED